MGAVQLRRYEIRPGELADFLKSWHELVPIRRRHGFSVVFAMASDDESEFVWAVRHEDDFEAAERKYYEDPERNEVGARVTPHVSQIHVTMARPIEP
ncbi:MAG TPA: NIPSNAP family protein [Acidimicrobiales bacterium]|nr:NIPSNAP family protein [Acidimicrobiales bacterium]